MTRHFKLTSGDIVEVTSDSQGVTTSGITGRLIGITQGNGKTCFIFRAENDDIIRFYLDYGRRPASRLLILLCAGITKIRDHDVEIVSVKNDIPGQSRLNMRFVSLDGIAVEAPYVLPPGYNSRNGERILLILAALEYSEQTATETDNAEPEDAQAEIAIGQDTSETTVGDLSEHAPLVVGGLDSLPAGERTLTVHDTRQVTLVRNYPLIAAVIDPNERLPRTLSEADMIEAIRNLDADIIRRTFFTKKEREAFKDGLVAGLAIYEHGPRCLFIESREGVDAVLQMQATALVIDENEEY